mgnify:CR=1 FL=1
MELIISCGREIFGRVKGGYDEDANFFIIFIPENICLSNEEIWRYYILLFGDIGGCRHNGIRQICCEWGRVRSCLTTT